MPKLLKGKCVPAIKAAEAAHKATGRYPQPVHMFICTPLRYVRLVEIQFHSFLNSALDTGEWIPVEMQLNS